MVFEAVKRNAMVGQTAAHLGVAGQGLGLVVMVGEHRLHTQVLGKLNHRVDGLAVAHQQTRLCMGRAFAPCGIEFLQRSVDEGHATVLARQLVQDGGVKHKGRVHMLGMLQGGAERGVVVQAQIPAKPHQNAVKLV